MSENLAAASGAWGSDATALQHDEVCNGAALSHFESIHGCQLSM
jgi:hypothetical protein